MAAVGLVAPLQALRLLRGGFAHLPRLPSARGFCLASDAAAHLTREGPEQLLCSLFAILNITLCFSLICSVWDSCGGTCLGEEGPILGPRLFYRTSLLGNRKAEGVPALVQLRTSCPSRDIGLVGGCVQLPMGATTSGLGRSRFMTSCPGKDGSGVASSHPQSIGAAKGSVQAGPRSPSSWACQQSASCVQLSAMLRLPAPAACLTSPTAHRVLVDAHVPLCMHTHTSTQAGRLPPPRPRHLPTPWPRAIGIGASPLKDGMQTALSWIYMCYHLMYSDWLVFVHFYCIFIVIKSCSNILSAPFSTQHRGTSAVSWSGGRTAA